MVNVEPHLVSRMQSNCGGSAAVVSNGRGCAEVGGHILSMGGSAADAAIATLLCEGVLLPDSMGLGGGFVATIYTRATRKVETLIARECAPALATENMFMGQNKISVEGALACAVPGEILGYWELHQKYGRLPWKYLFEPTIKLCFEGHYVSENLAGNLKQYEKIIRNEPTLCQIFIKQNGCLYKQGDLLRRPILGHTLERIANCGIGELYGGGILGQWLVEDLQQMGGILIEADLTNYKVHWEDKDHVTVNLPGGYQLFTTPLPTSGIVLTFILNVLSEMYIEDHNIYWQRVIETFKHAFGQRTKLGDMYNDEEMRPTILSTFNLLKNKKFIKHVRTLIKDYGTSENTSFYGADFSTKADHGTANMAVLEANGDAITVTSTINTFFGSKMCSPRTGIILNNHMDDFSTPGVVNSFGVHASSANSIKPGKRPMSSMCPTIIIDCDGNVQMLVGAAGGTRITTTVATAIIKYIIMQESLYDSVNTGRLHHQLVPMQVVADPDVPDEVLDYLKQVGHDVITLDTIKGAVTAIGVRDGVPEAIFDRSRYGSVSILR